jgi:Mitochondrial carrier protein
VSIVQKEGVGALFRGALPRALWVAPVGAMNFAGALCPASTRARSRC